MANTCKICRRKNRNAIDQAIYEGQSLRHIASQFKGISYKAVHRHVPHAIKNAAVALRQEEKRENDAEELRQDASRIRKELWDLCELAKQEKKRTLQLACLDKLQTRLMDWVKVIVEAKLAAPRGIADEAEWIKLRTKILVVLDRFPTAKKALIKALHEAGA